MWMWFQSDRCYPFGTDVAFDMSTCTVNATDPLKPKCPVLNDDSTPAFPEWLTIILLCGYLLFANVLLLNLLIAIFKWVPCKSLAPRCSKTWHLKPDLFFFLAHLAVNVFLFVQCSYYGQSGPVLLARFSNNKISKKDCGNQIIPLLRYFVIFQHVENILCIIDSMESTKIKTFANYTFLTKKKIIGTRY